MFFVGFRGSVNQFDHPLIDDIYSNRFSGSSERLLLRGVGGSGRLGDTG